MGSGALPLILLLMSFIHAGLIQESPKVVVKVTPDESVFSGETVTLTCDIQGAGRIQWRYSWFRNGNTFYPHTTAAEISFTADVYHSGEYSCRGERSDSQISDISSAVTLTVSDFPRSSLTVTPDSPVFTGETVNLKCEIETRSNSDWIWRIDQTYNWRYEWYKDTDSVMLQMSDRYTVNRDTLTIRGVNTSDQGQYWCRGQRDQRPNSSQDSNRIHLSVNVSDSSSSLLVTAVVVGSSVFLLIFISLLLLWRYKKNKDQQRNINQTSVPNQSAESQPENFPLQSGDPEPLADVTYSEITVKKNKKKMDKGKSSESGDTLYSELKHSTDRGADAGDETCAQALRKKNKTRL